MVYSWRDPRNLRSLALLAALLAFALHLLRDMRSSDARATMGLSAWLLLPWLPVSHIPVRLGTLVAERTMYIPSIGALALVVHLLRPPPARRRRAAGAVASAAAGGAAARGGWLLRVRRAWWRRRGALPVGLAVGYLARTTLCRTLDWRNDESAFVSAVRVCPRSAKNHNQMCTLRSNQGRQRGGYRTPRAVPARCAHQPPRRAVRTSGAAAPFAEAAPCTHALRVAALGVACRTHGVSRMPLD